MTFPVVTARTSTTDPSATASHSINLGGPSAGELLVVFATANDTGGPFVIDEAVSGAAWTRLQAENISEVRLGVFVKVATGGDALTLLTPASVRVASICYRVSGHGSALAIGTFPGTLGGTADPPNVSITGASQDLLFIAAAGTSQSVASAPPASYGTLTTASITSNIFLSTAERALTGTADNPGTFTIASQPWIATTVAVHEFPVTTSARLTQEAAEATSDATPFVRVTQVAAEAASTPSSAARFTQFAVETVSTTTSDAGAGPSMLFVAT